MKDHVPQTRRSSDASDKWEIDKKIPLYQIFVVAAQIGVFIWYAATMNAAIGDATRRVSLVEDSQKNIMLGPNGLSERMTRVEEQQKAAQKSLDRIESLVVAQPPSPPERTRR